MKRISRLISTMMLIGLAGGCSQTRIVVQPDPQYAPVDLNAMQFKPEPNGSIFQTGRSVRLFEDNKAFRIGDAAIAAIPCEVFAETGLEIKKKSPHRFTFAIELANGYGGYLPSREQHELGGYETWPARSSFLEIDAESKIRTEALRLLRDLATKRDE